MERKKITSKQSGYILIGIIIILCIANAGLLLQSKRYKNIALKEESLRQRAEWTIRDEIKNVRETVSLDSVAKGHHLILRYDANTCLACITKAEELLEEVFGKEYLTRELCCIGAYGQVEPPRDILGIQSDERITPMDDVYTPYFCVINENGDVLFTLLLPPDNYDYNLEILTRLKKHFLNQEKNSK